MGKSYKQVNISREIRQFGKVDLGSLSIYQSPIARSIASWPRKPMYYSDGGSNLVTSDFFALFYIISLINNMAFFSCLIQIWRSFPV